MRYNGLQLVIGMAVHKLDDARLTRWRDALVLGAILALPLLCST